MSDFQLSQLRNSSVWAVYRIKDRIEMDPSYQRESDIWPRDKRQLLIDTIVNQFDVPKIYLHKFKDPRVSGEESYDFAVIDGKQRLDTIFQFIDGEFGLSEDFEYMAGTADTGGVAELSGLTYADIARKYPAIKADFDAYLLDIVCMETEDAELIEELFSRLNEAVPLNAPEKRNALPGPLPVAVRELAKHPFFTECLPFSNRRYRHYDFAAKILLAVERGEIVDTKKIYVDRFFERTSGFAEEDVRGYSETARAVLTSMRKIFTNSDVLLRQVGMAMLYFYLFLINDVRKAGIVISRELLRDFNDRRTKNRQTAEKDIAEADYDLLEFDRYAQSPNDAVAMRFRLEVLDQVMFDGKLGFNSVEIEQPK